MTHVHTHFCNHHWERPERKAASQAGNQEKPSYRDWVAVSGAILGGFMAVLDIQVTNSSLQYIQGGLAASLDEGSWISTSYLMAEIIIIPLTSWLSDTLSTRRYLMLTCTGFLIFSVLCGLCTSLPEMIICRVGQGLTGGAMIPLALSTVTTKLPKSKQPIGLALFGFTATFAPAIGPTIGGWLTITYSWHYIFYVNVIPGIVLIWAVWYGHEREPAHLERLAEGDWFGIITMAIGLGCLIAVLEEGERKDWFTAEWIRYASVSAAIFLPLAIINELTTPRPFIQLHLLKNRGLALASVLGLALGIGLYGTVYILPLYLAQIQGYDAMQIGEVVMWLGLPQLLILPIVPWAMRYVDVRWLVAFGLALFAASMMINGYMSHDTAMPQLEFPQLVRALGQPFVIVPLSSLATATLARAEQGQAAAIFNVMRNLGGSIGIALLSTFTTIREQYHYAIISSHVTDNTINTQSWFVQAVASVSAQSGGPAMARSQAIELLRNLVRRDANIMAYSDCFYIIGLILAAGCTLIFLAPKPKREQTRVH
ncbi:MAG TPA: MDR family MFS transporter [Stellaceae bacterium]